ncbi:hypothetical protein HNQ07_000627 [Deinococcus metalli]|uniref:Glycosyl hydrolase family 98 putative carbohydrate-binding module domain-containing protein n=1 Tax=Deinococcus metalli TaxID=1141878 RepID=A0A7W8NPU7_9DEIO|nr:NPCBM/NEW2 domain-containing protein [Deinococcus metalli]MBB5375183.1 hypothetical protein [Deinococcus metalli]GHF31133.1 hypothetical protein GCM10017781_04150 [Deinococcus metalli]
MRSNFIQRLAGVTATLVLVACGQTPSTTQDNPYANGVSHDWAQLPTTALTAQQLTAGDNTLQYETPTFAQNGWGPFERNRSNGEQQAGDGKPLTLNGSVYKQGYGVHANSDLRFNLAGPNGELCTRFITDIGVDDEVGSKGSVIFQVLLDGQLKYTSARMTGSSPTATIDLDVAGWKQLQLVVTSAGDGIDFDHADWANPRVYCQASSGTLQMALSNNGFATVIHTQSQTFQLTLASRTGSVQGPVDLRIESTDPASPSLLQLNTARVDFSGTGPVTRDIVIAAPKIRSNAEIYHCVCRVIASVGGKDVGSVPLDVYVYPASTEFRFVPSDGISAKVGSTVTVMVEVTTNVTPMRFTVSPYLNDSWADSETYGVIVGPRDFTVTSKISTVPLQIQFKKDPPNEYHVKTFIFLFAPVNFTPPTYQNLPQQASLVWTAIP